MMHPSNRVELETLDTLFTYHAPTLEQQAAYVDVRQAAKELAKAIIKRCPPCADTSAALRKVREAVMTANAAIALGGAVSAPAQSGTDLPGEKRSQG